MLPQVDALGRVFAVAGGTPVSWNAGVGYDALGRMCTTTVVGAGDFYLGGLRLDALGRVVVGAQSGSLVYNGGLPFNAADGSLARQIDTVPVATDPYVRGMRVGPAGGVYFTTAAPGLLDAFSDGFSGGFQ